MPDEGFIPFTSLATRRPQASPGTPPMKPENTKHLLARAKSASLLGVLEVEPLFRAAAIAEDTTEGYKRYVDWASSKVPGLNESPRPDENANLPTVHITIPPWLKPGYVVPEGEVIDALPRDIVMHVTPPALLDAPDPADSEPLPTAPNEYDDLDLPLPDLPATSPQPVPVSDERQRQLELDELLGRAASALPLP